MLEITDGEKKEKKKKKTTTTERQTAKNNLNKTMWTQALNKCALYCIIIAVYVFVWTNDDDRTIIWIRLTHIGIRMRMCCELCVDSIRN